MLLIPKKYYDLPSEGAFLGSLIVDKTLIATAREVLPPNDIYKPEHRTIYDAIVDTWERCNDFDLVMLHATLTANGTYESVGGREYLTEIAYAVPSSASRDYYAKIIHEHAVIRRQYVAYNAAMRALDAAGPIPDRLDAAAKAMAEIPLHEGNGKPKIVLEPMDTIEPVAIDWLWANRIPAGMVSLIVGLPGQGKSFISLDMAAKISRGTQWPDGSPCQKGKVLLFALEEDPAVSTRPRLDACGADCSRILLFKGIQHHGVESETIDIHQHLPTLEKTIAEQPDLRMVVFDPITSVMGGADQNSQAEVRDALTLLAQFAKRTGVAVVGISHFAKRTDTAAVYKTLGSVSFAAVARSVWCVHRDPISEENPSPPRLFLPIKANYSIEAQGLSFEIVNGGVEWSTATITRTIDEAIKPDKRKQQAVNNDAVDFLKDILSDGQEHLAVEIYAEAKQAGISEDRLGRATTNLGMYRGHGKRKSTADGKYYWSLPNHSMDGDML